MNYPARVYICDAAGCGAEAVVRGSHPGETPPLHQGRLPEGWWQGGSVRPYHGQTLLCPAHAHIGVAWAAAWAEWNRAYRLACSSHWREAEDAASQARFAALGPVRAWEAANPKPALRLAPDEEVP